MNTLGIVIAVAAPAFVCGGAVACWLIRTPVMECAECGRLREPAPLCMSCATK